MKKKVVGDKHSFHTRRNDSHLLNFRFNNFKTEDDIKMSCKNLNNSIINTNNNNNMSNKNKSSLFNSQIYQGNVNKINTSNYNSNNSSNYNSNNTNNYNSNNSNNNNSKPPLQAKRSAFYSTKDLGTYNFNDLSQLKKKTSLQQNVMNNNINYQQQYPFFNNNGNISNIRTNNYLVYYP